MLWDIKLKIGHATRSVDECVSLGKEDLTIRTSLLECRYLAGSKTLSNKLDKRLWKELFRKTGPEFVEQKLIEREDRHKKQGGQRFMLEKCLKKLGYSVTVSENGEDAIERIAESVDDDSKQFDLIILDMIMGDGLDGLSTMMKVRQMLPEQKVVIASGHAETDRTTEAIDLGARWIAKPYTADAIASLVRDILDND